MGNRESKMELDKKRYDTEINNSDCFISLVKSVFAMILDGKGHSYITNTIPITKETVDIFRSVSSLDNVDLIEILAARDVFKININSEKVLQIVRSVKNIYESQAKTLIVNDNVKFKEYFNFIMPLYKQYLIYLNESVNKSLLSENTKLVKGVSNELITEFMDLKASYIPVLEKIFFKYEVIRITVDEQALSTCLLSYKARIEGRKVGFVLIKAGANFPFITDNITAYISLSKFKQLRSMFNVSKAPEPVSVRLGSNIYNDFISMMKNKHSTVDIYMSLHRAYKLRIDTLVLYIDSVLESKNENIELSRADNY